MSTNFLEEFDNKKIILLGTAAVGLATLWILLKKSKTKKRYRFPVEVDTTSDAFDRDFLECLATDHEKALVMLHKLYPDECTLTLDKQSGLWARLFPNCSYTNKEKKIIFLNSIEAVKRFSKTNQGSVEPIPDRPRNFLLNIITKGYLGSFFRMYDAKLKEVRKSSAAGLHKLMSLPNFDSNLVDEVQHFITFLDETIRPGSDGCVLENAPLFLQQIPANMIVMIGLGLRFEYDHDSNAPVKQQINHISEVLGCMNVVQLDGFKESDAKTRVDVMNYINTRLEAFYGFITGAVVGYKSKYDPDVLNTFGDYVIGKQIEKLKREKKIDDSDNYSDKDIIVQVWNLFVAGAYTTGFAMAYAFYYLAKNQRVQEKIFEEISRVAGTSGSIYPKSRDGFPYTNAAINEILRLASPQTLTSRATQQDVQIDGYDLPAETTVLINSYAIHRDSRFWKDSEELKPERWLDQNGNLVPFLDSFIAFGVAPRACLADGFSRVILFLVISNCVQRFKFEYLPGKEVSSSSVKGTGTLGYARRPHNYHLRIKRRN
jgi:cytochrome P450